MKKILAISGGVDSMVMLDLAARHYNSDKLIVPHFDHGIRENSSEDAEFVKRKAAEYDLEFRQEEGKLGTATSEAEAREARYAFLNRVVEEVGGGEIWTAHHLDDLVESVIVNLIRGTGWRGLAVLDSERVRRPLLGTELIYEPMDRAAIFEYAAKRGLVYREDPSNSWDEYLRNRIRHEMDNDSPLGYEQKMEIYRLWRRQKRLRNEIEGLILGLTPEEGKPWERAWFREMEPEVALELLRTGTQRASIKATRPQLRDFLRAIREYQPGKKFNLPGDRLVKIGKESFNLDKDS